MITLTLEGKNLSVSTPHIVADTVDYLTGALLQEQQRQALDRRVKEK